ncbi:hypothetical protein G3R49_05860 [Shewanella sp. WXL01]|uniref:hypothetical protein n=1 Tax=Shewanella sp. WXL01 TaxID=2709721 RepID=UPI0014382E90|nr:hypothetical protein [Shewanella sp. WXL01]NKF50094.1 hypothetical protein [Shewanella sp. WXL01]
MKKLVLHIGPHKTASTYIQKSLLENTAYLSSKGWTYPDDEILQYGHHPFVNWLLNGDYDQLEHYTERLKALNSNILLSSENFDRLNQQQIQKLHDVVNKCFEVHILYVYRRADEKLISSWSESIKHGNVQVWQDYALEHLLRPFVSSCLGDTGILLKYAKVFGKQYIAVVDYDIAKSDTQDLVELVLALYQIDDTGYCYNNQVINQAPNKKIIEVLRLLNRYHSKKTGTNAQSKRLRARFFKYLNNEAAVRKKIDNLPAWEDKVSIADTFVLNRLKANFHKEFDANIVNYDDSFVLPAKVFALPTVELQSDSDFIKKLYADVMSVEI